MSLLALPITDVQRSSARVAAVTYPLAIFAVAFANFGLRGDLIIDGDVPETLRRIAAAEPAYRLSVAFDLGYALGMVVLLAALYRTLAPVHRGAALLATLLKFLYAGTAVLVALSSLTLLRFATEPTYLNGLGSAPLHALFQLTASGAWDQYYVGLIFWALSSTLYAYLWLKGGYVPRLLAFAGILSSAWCAVCAVAFLLNSAFADLVNVWVFDTPMALYYLVLSVWLLVKGLPRLPASPVTHLAP